MQNLFYDRAISRDSFAGTNEQEIHVYTFSDTRGIRKMGFFN